MSDGLTEEKKVEVGAGQGQGEAALLALGRISSIVVGGLWFGTPKGFREYSLTPLLKGEAGVDGNSATRNILATIHALSKGMSGGMRSIRTATGTILGREKKPCLDVEGIEEGFDFFCIFSSTVWVDRLDTSSNGDDLLRLLRTDPHPSVHANSGFQRKATSQQREQEVLGV